MTKLMPTNAASAAAAARSILDLELHDLLDRSGTDGDGDDADSQHDVAEGLAQHRAEVGRRDQRENRRKAKGQERDDDPRDPGLRGEGADLALDTHPFADGEGDGVEDLSE